LTAALPEVDAFVLAMNDAGRAINLYYGAADTSIALAPGSVSQLLGWLDRNGTVAS